VEDISHHLGGVGSPMYAALATWPDLSTSTVQPIFDFISMPMTLALALASALEWASGLALAIVSQGTWIPIGPVTARFGTLQAAMYFSPVVGQSCYSMESKAS